MGVMDHVSIPHFTEHLETIKGSRFIAWVAPADSEEEAQNLLARAREQFPDATHHCSAWRIGETVRFSDDGEPGGTAGRPMLEVLLKRDLMNVATVVVRYFGGTRLGAGGLVRAYSGAVARALDAAGTVEVLEQSDVSLTVPFALADSVIRFVADQADAVTTRNEYSADGLELTVRMPAGQVADFRAALTDHTSGSVTVHD